MNFSTNVKRIGNFINDPRGTICVITDGNSCGIFWKAGEGYEHQEGVYKNGYFVSGSTYELSDEDAEQMFGFLK